MSVVERRPCGRSETKAAAATADGIDQAHGKRLSAIRRMKKMVTVAGQITATVG
jgi:hypothetical protein